MKTELPVHLQKVIENVCGQGCQQVKQVIEKLQHAHNDAIANTATLSEQERSQILDELQSIMAIYKKDPR